MSGSLELLDRMYLYLHLCICVHESRIKLSWWLQRPEKPEAMSGSVELLDWMGDEVCICICVFVYLCTGCTKKNAS